MINIGKVINGKCSDLVNKRCFPIVAEQTTNKPFICYSRQSAYPQTTKDRFIYEMEHYVSVNIVTEKYDEGIEILEEIVKRFDEFEGEVNGINIIESKLNNISEYFIDDAYVQTVTINLKTK